jgi:hypothetical protein
MAFHRGGRDLETDSGSLAAAYPNAKARLAVFVHAHHFICATLFREPDAAVAGLPPRRREPISTC